MKRTTADRLRVIVYLPNKKGQYNPVTVPFHIIKILEHVVRKYNYTYKLIGVNPQRPGYGIRADLSVLEAWVTKYYADFDVKEVHEERNNYYGIFEMTDPVAQQLEKAGLLK